MLDRLRSDKLAVPAAMAFVVIGLMLVAVSVAVPRMVSLHAYYSRSTIDFAQGLLFGIAIVFEITGIAALIPALAAARAKKKNPPAE
jgi:uncharacterized membrane protein